MKFIYILPVFICILLYSCSKDNIPFDPENPFLGYWNYYSNQDSVSVYKRNTGFTESPGYKFNSDGTLIQRKNSGWCGTPPISYFDYPGDWTVLNDTLIGIQVGYWGGIETYNMDIESVDSEFLRFLITPANRYNPER